MPFQQSTNRQYRSPAAANSPTAAGTGTAWNSSAAVEIAPNTSSEVWLLTGINVWTPDDNSPTGFSSDWEVDILTDAGLATVFATICGRHSVPGTHMYSQPYRLKIPIDGLTGRHGFRIRVGSTRTDTYHVSINYFKNPVNGTVLTTTQPLKVSSPSAAPVTLTAGSTPWVDGSWATLIASAAADLVLTDAMLAVNTGSAQGEVDIGTRVGGVATKITTIPVGTTTRGSPFIHGLPNPLDNVASGVEVVGRLRAATGSITCGAKLIYHEKPL